MMNAYNFDHRRKSPRSHQKERFQDESQNPSAYQMKHEISSDYENDDEIGCDKMEEVEDLSKN